MSFKPCAWIVHTRTNKTYFVVGSLLVKINGAWVEHTRYIGATGQEYARQPSDMAGKFTVLSEKQT